MRDLIKQKAFIATFLIASSAICLISLIPIPFQTLSETLFGDEPIKLVAGATFYGFPFNYYASHCYGGNYYYPGLVGNILFAAILGTILGLIFSFLWKKVVFRKSDNLPHHNSEEK